MQESLKLFMSEGFKRFPEAMDTIVMYANSLKSQLQSCLQERSDWGPFTPSKSKKPTSGGPPLSGECWLYAVQAGQLGKADVYIEVGYWWNAPGIEWPVIAYASISETPPEWKRYTFRPKNARVKVKDISSRTRLYLQATPAGEVVDDISTLLDELIVAAQQLLAMEPRTE